MVARQLSRTAFFGCSASLSLDKQCFSPEKGLKRSGRPVAQLAEQRIPNPQVGGSIPSWPATLRVRWLRVPVAPRAPVMWRVSMSEAAASRLDSLKWVVVLALVAGGVYGNSFYADQPILYRVIALLVLALIAGWVASLTQRGGEFLTLVKGSRTEIRKVVWPTRQETTQTTLIVFVFVIITGLILWGLDSVLGWLASLILG
jgi:preprotein translocase subunit SecE